MKRDSPIPPHSYVVRRAGRFFVPWSAQDGENGALRIKNELGKRGGGQPSQPINCQSVPKGEANMAPLCRARAQGVRICGHQQIGVYRSAKRILYRGRAFFQGFNLVSA